MSGLAELQRSLQRHLLDPASPAAAAAAEAAVRADARAGARRRLDVYAHGYRARLLEVLGNDHPGLRALAGAEDFEALALAYVAATPSAHRNVRWYGGGLAGFLRTARPWSERPALAGMAELDWRFGLAFDAADEAAVTIAEMAALAPDAWPGLGFGFHPSLQRLDLDWNVGAIRRAADRGEPLPAPQPLDPPQPWLVWRRDFAVRYRRLEDDEAAALDAAAGGARFAELCERLCRWHDEAAVAMRAASLLRGWVEAGWIARLRPADAP